MRIITLHLLIALLCISTVALAQFETATVLGTVRDSSGGVIPNVAVALTNMETGQRFESLTDAEGMYQFVNVRIGSYTVSAELAGFATAVADHIRVTVNARQRVDLTMQVGQASESISVVDALQLVETESSDRGQVIGRQLVVSLPLNGRSYANLALLSPGVRESTINASREGSFNVNGLRSTYNNFLLDGVDNNAYGTSNQGFSNQVVQPSPDAVEEFKVQTNNYSAEFGRSGGAVVNVSMRSGTNALHGTVWEFNRNDALNAVGFFKPAGGIKPVLNRNQFGFTLGGPVRPNRTFFFTHYEGFREISKSLRFATLPTLAQRQGVLGTPIRHPLTGVVYADGTVPGEAITPFARQVLGALPSPTSQGASNNFQTLARNRNYNDKGDIKIDHTFSSAWTAFGRVSHRKVNIFEAPDIPGPSGGGGNGFVRVLNQQLAAGTTFIVGPTSIAEFRLAISRTRAGKEPPELGGASMRELYGISGLPEDRRLTGGLTAQNVSGFTGFGRQATNPQWQNPFVVNPRVNYSWLWRRHSLKAGYEVQEVRTEVQDVNPLYGRDTYSGGFSRPANGTGAAAAYNLADFMFGARSQYALVNFFVANYRQRLQFMYLQDDFKLNPALTLNLGIRYEYATPQWEKDNRLSNFDPASQTMLRARSGSVYDRALVHPDRNNLAPRVGFAYSLSPQLAIRGGYGIGYIHFNRSGGGNLLAINGPQVVIATIEQSATAPGFRTTSQGYPANLVAPETFDPLKSTVSYLPADTRSGYVQNWHLSVQREVLSKTLVDLAYVGNHGLKLLLFADYNQARPNLRGEDAPLQSRRPLQTFSAISTGYPAGFSNYHGLQLRVEHRGGRGLNLINSFTWSKAMDNVAQALEDPNGNSANPQDARNLMAERSVSAYDQPLNNTTSLVWSIPFGRNERWGADAGSIVEAIAGGWQVSAIHTMTSGQPINLRYTPATPFKVTADLPAWLGGTSYRPNLIGNPVTPKAERSIDNYLNRATVVVPTDASQPFGNAGRNTARSHAFYQLDFSIGKEFRLRGEDQKIQFRAEFFNGLNKTNFRPASGDRSATSFGTIRSTFPARQIQLALRLTF